jgi:hypothetical protein
MAKEVVRGTCGACFRSIRVNASGGITRHGWVERGGRRVGVYDHAWHTGPCFGSRWRPYEVSPDCTKAFVEGEVFPAAVRAVAQVEYVATRPDFIHEGWVHNRSDGWREVMVTPYCKQGTFEAKVRSGDRKFYAGREDVPAYETLHEAATTHAAGERDELFALGTFCLAQIDAWRPGMELSRVVERKGPMAHAPGFMRKGEVVLTKCGRTVKSWAMRSSLWVAGEGDEVTYPKCLAAPSGESVA